MSLLAKTGVPQPAELVDVVEHDCEWEEFQVGQRGGVRLALMARGWGGWGYSPWLGGGEVLVGGWVRSAWSARV